LALLLVAELVVTLWLRGVTVGRALAGRDPVAGTVHALMLGLFTVMPLLVARR
jgi:hypothetical protein